VSAMTWMISCAPPHQRSCHRSHSADADAGCARVMRPAATARISRARPRLCMYLRSKRATGQAVQCFVSMHFRFSWPSSAAAGSKAGAMGATPSRSSPNRVAREEIRPPNAGA
jgi:hypothetical protein